jgi:hypothetical protein
MKFRIHYNGRYEDYLDIEEDTIEEVIDSAKRECGARNWEEENCWSEEL